MSTTKGRLALVDPVCVSERGHNLPLLLDYRTYVQELFGVEVEVHVTDLLPQRVYTDTGLLPTFPFPYMNNKQLVKNLNLRGPAASPTLEADLAAAFGSLIATDGSSTTMVFPYADFMGVLACRDALDASAHPERVSVALRFIGVLDFSSPPGVDAIAGLRAAIRRMQELGAHVTLAAESAPYAAELSDVLGEPVDLVPPPAPTWVRELADASASPDAPFVYCPGSGRDDKGFTELPLLISQYRQRYPGSALEFVCQEPAPSTDQLLHKAHVRLQALPGVTVLPSLISLPEMATLYRTCAFALLPYSRGTYRHRSSASLADAFGAGTSIVTYTGTGLESYVTHYGIGRTATDLDGLVTACHEMFLEPQGVRTRRTAAAMQRYESDTRAAWRRWLEGTEQS